MVSCSTAVRALATTRCSPERRPIRCCGVPRMGISSHPHGGFSAATRSGPTQIRGAKSASFFVNRPVGDSAASVDTAGSRETKGDVRMLTLAKGQDRKQAAETRLLEHISRYGRLEGPSGMERLEAEVGRE